MQFILRERKKPDIRENKIFKLLPPDIQEMILVEKDPAKRQELFEYAVAEMALAAARRAELAEKKLQEAEKNLEEAKKQKRGRPARRKDNTATKRIEYKSKDGKPMPGNDAMLQSRFIHSALQVTQKSGFETNFETGQLEYKDKSNSVTIAGKGMDIDELTPETNILLSMLYRGYSANIMGKDLRLETLEANRKVLLSLDGYMEERGLRNRPQAETELRKVLPRLEEIKLIFDEYHIKRKSDGTPVYKWEMEDGKRVKKPVKVKKTYRAPLIGKVLLDEETKRPKMVDGCFVVYVDFDVAEHLATQPAMPYYAKIATIATRHNPNAPMLAEKILYNRFINNGEYQQNIISVKTLLKVLSYAPTAGANSRRRIMDTFERDMEKLVDIGMLKEWNYCKSHHEKLTDEEMDNMKYSLFETLLVEYTLE